MLTPKQEKFARKYLECGNASEAYRCAYDCSRMKDASVNRNAFAMLHNVKIASRIDYLKSHLAEASGISALRILEEHAKIAFSDATRIRSGWMSLKEFEALTPEERACIKGVETKERKLLSNEGETVIDTQVKVTLYDKQKSLDSISQMLGYNAPQKQEVTVTGSRPVIMFSGDDADEGEKEDTGDGR